MSTASSKQKEEKDITVYVGKTVGSEIGRLLSGEAITPFYVVRFPHPEEQDGQWASLDEAMIACGLSDYLNGVNPRHEQYLNDPKHSHRAWLNANDEDKVAHLLRCKIECNPYIRDIVATNRYAFQFVNELGSSLPRFAWLENELDHLRKYYRKSYAQGHQQPYVRIGRKRPYVWK